MKKQLTLAASDFERFRKPTRREKFLAEMDKVVPWAELATVICAGPDFSGHEFGVKSCLKKEPCDAEGIEGGWGCAGLGGRSA